MCNACMDIDLHALMLGNGSTIIIAHCAQCSTIIIRLINTAILICIF